MRSKRGFAAMDEKTRRAISRKGGRASQSSGRGHELTSADRKKGGGRGRSRKSMK